MTKMGPGKQELHVVIDREVIKLIKRLHRAYNHRTGLSLSYAKFIEGMMTGYLDTQNGKELLQYATKHGI